MWFFSLSLRCSVRDVYAMRGYVCIVADAVCVRPLKLKFHGTDTDADFLADFHARILARNAGGSRPAAACAARSACRLVRGLVRRALFLARMSVGDARVYTCTYVYCT